jgi:hypothetical protein
LHGLKICANLVPSVKSEFYLSAATCLTGKLGLAGRQLRALFGIDLPTSGVYAKFRFEQVGLAALVTSLLSLAEYP